MPSTLLLTPEDRALLRRALREGPVRLVEPNPDVDASTRIDKLVSAGLFRTVVGPSGDEGVCRFLALSGAGIAKLN